LQKFTNKEVGLVYCDSYTIKTKNDSIINKSIRSFRISGMDYKQLLEKNFVGSTSFVLIRKEALNECGFFNTEMESGQDYELWLRLSKKYKIDYVDIPLVNYYAHEGERISTNVNKKIQGLEQIIKLNYLYLQEHRSEEHTSELQSRFDLVCRLLLEKKKQASLQGIERLYCNIVNDSS